MSTEPPRIRREKRTIQAMATIFCRAYHGMADQLCVECREVVDYAYCRLDRCPFGGEKPTCANCPIHCYKPAMRTRVKQIMRYAGPRMLLRHPILAMLHWFDGLRRRGDHLGG
jgi:hypothetical protein